MKNIIKIFLLLFVALSTSMCVSHRTVVVQDSVMPPPPMWGPAGFDGIRYYYMPDMMVYYDLHTGMFIYPRGRRWVTRNYLPGYYGHFDLYNTHVVVINNYFGPSPYQFFNQHRVTYPVGYRGQAYQTIGRRGDDGRNYFAPYRGASAQGGRNSTAQGGRENATGSGRQSIENNGGRGSSTDVPQGDRGSSSTGVNSSGRGETTVTTNGRGTSAQPSPGSRAQNATQTTTTGRNSNASSNNVRSTTTSSGTRSTQTDRVSPSTRSTSTNRVAPPRMSPQDAQAAQQRTKQIKQAKPASSRSPQAAPTRSSGGRSSTPTTTSSGGGRRG